MRKLLIWISFSWSGVSVGVQERSFVAEFAQNSLPMPAAFTVAAEANQMQDYPPKRALDEPGFDFVAEHAPVLTRRDGKQQCDLGPRQGERRGWGMGLWS